jgi:hypothetical protein
MAAMEPLLTSGDVLVLVRKRAQTFDALLALATRVLRLRHKTPDPEVLAKELEKHLRHLYNEELINVDTVDKTPTLFMLADLGETVRDLIDDDQEKGYPHEPVDILCS